MCKYCQDLPSQLPISQLVMPPAFATQESVSKHQQTPRSRSVFDDERKALGMEPEEAERLISI